MSTVDLFHIGAFLCYAAVLFSVAGNIRVKRLRNLSSLIQLTVVLLCVDLMIGFFLIDRTYGSSASASWMVKAMYGLPALLVGSIAWMLRAHKLAAARQEDKSA